MAFAELSATLTFDREAFQTELDEVRDSVEVLANAEPIGDATDERMERIVRAGVQDEVSRLVENHATVETGR